MKDLENCPCGKIAWQGRAMLDKDGDWIVQPVCPDCRAKMNAQERRYGVDGKFGPLLPLDQADLDAWVRNNLNAQAERLSA